MINATEACRETLDQIHRNHLHLFDAIGDAISGAIEKEQFTVKVDFPEWVPYTPAIEYKLQSLGYKVSFDKVVDGLFSAITVTWYPKNNQ